MHSSRCFCLKQVVGNFCMDLAIKKAKEYGIGWIACKGNVFFHYRQLLLNCDLECVTVTLKRYASSWHTQRTLRHTFNYLCSENFCVFRGFVGVLPQRCRERELQVYQTFSLLVRARVDTGFCSGGGAPLRSDETEGLQQILYNREVSRRSSQGGRICEPVRPSLRSAPDVYIKS